MQVSQGEPPPGHSRDGVYHFKMPPSSEMSSESSPQVGEGWDRPLPESQMPWGLISLINSSFLHRHSQRFALSPQLTVVAYLIMLQVSTGLVCLALGLIMTLCIYIASLFSKNT